MSDMITEFAAARQGTTLLDPFLQTGADRMNLRPPLRGTGLHQGLQPSGRVQRVG